MKTISHHSFVSLNLLLVNFRSVRSDEATQIGIIVLTFREVSQFDDVCSADNSDIVLLAV